MSPILGARGGLSASAYGLFAPSAAAGSSYESIATQTGNGSATTLSFTSIPQTYKHLQIRILARSATASPGSGWIDAVFNSDSSSSYSFHYLVGDGSTATYGASASRSNARIGLLWGANERANTFEATVCDILDYTNTNKYKTTRSFIGGDTNASTYQEVYLVSNAWRSTSAITQIDLTAGGWNFATGTSIALYGIKG
jgi:hypothetical protein